MWFYIVLWVIGTVYVLVVAGSILVVILENRQPVKTMAWVMVLLAFPVVGLAIFYFFGQDWRKERIILRKSVSLLTRKALSMRQSGAEPPIPHAYERLIRYFERESLAGPYTGNAVRLYTSGQDFLDQLLHDIDRAVRHIHLETYIIDDDRAGRALGDALIAAARRGVEVRFIYDDVGCWHVRKAFFDRMDKAGVQVVAFLPVRFPRFTRKANFRNHRKICVIDGRTGYVGGMNIADRYTDRHTWADMHLRLQGNAVYGLQQTFLFDWYFMTRILINDAVYYPAPHISEAGGLTRNALMQIVSSSPASRWPDIMNGYVWAIHNAQRYIYISTPYFMPTESILSALQMAAAAGVDVRLMVTACPDGRWVRLANESYYADVLHSGVRLYRYGPGFHHSKYVVVDDGLVAIGSANMDFRSFENNFEVQAFVYDKTLACEVKQNFLDDMRRCNELSLDAWETRPRRARLAESFVRIFSPLL